ncbi:MAG: GtrA family protein [Eggerthellaceae bacterium]|jgi:putative flippase GtrA|nr:GtrA family protein [Eggerthellaceae bacterium]MCH4220381.1 GtrA family protein [Eggerthellaceae bacterium]
MKKLIAQLMKFSVVGVIAFIIDYGLLVFLTECFHIDYLVSATISFVVSVIFNYLASMRYVFTHKENMSRTREFVIFVVLSAVGLVINDVCMWAGVELLFVDYRITKLFATAIVMVWNFVTRKIFLDAGDAPQNADVSSAQNRDTLEHNDSESSSLDGQ